VEISIDGAGCSHAAFGRRPEAATYLLDFLASQITSAPASQYSVLVIHVLSPFVVAPVERAQSLQESLFGRAQTQPSALAADLADVLIPIRRRRVGAERKSNKASID